jgi:hypothetical protein
MNGLLSAASAAAKAPGTPAAAASAAAKAPASAGGSHGLPRLLVSAVGKPGPEAPKTNLPALFLARDLSSAVALSVHLSGVGFRGVFHGRGRFLMGGCRRAGFLMGPSPAIAFGSSGLAIGYSKPADRLIELDSFQTRRQLGPTGPHSWHCLPDGQAFASSSLGKQ